MTVLILILAALAGARTWRLIVVDGITEPVRKWIRSKLFRLQASGSKRKQMIGDKIEEGIECPFCLGFWLTAAWLAVGLASGGATWFILVAGAFACNYLGAQLNAWLDVKPITDGGGEITVMEEGK